MSSASAWTILKHVNDTNGQVKLIKFPMTFKEKISGLIALDDN